MLLRKPRCYAEIYNDLDGEIVNLFRVVRDRGDELTEKLRLTPFAREEFELAYQPTDDDLERARRTMIRSGMGFGSSGTSSTVKTGFRGSATRSGSHPAGDWSTRIQLIGNVVDRLQGVVIENRTAIEVLQYHDAKTTLHYVDPPYVHSERTWLGKGSKEAYKHEMTDADHRELATTLHGLKGMVILSGYPSDLYEEIYGSWLCVKRTAHADGAKKRIECLWLNRAAENAMPQRLLEETG